MNKIVEFYYHEKDSFGNEYMYSLDFKNRSEKKIEIKLGETKKSSDNILSEYEVTSIFKKVHDIIQNYEESYINNKIFDGKEYKIYAKYENDNVKKVRGKNKFPEGFSNLVDIVKR